VVIHVYDVPSAVLLLTREVGSREECERLAAADSAWVAALTDTCCLVAYDGDTGERMKWSGA
jgi:hypothetical protein